MSVCRVDAVGHEAHWLLDWPPTPRIESAISTLAQTGVKILITDVYVGSLSRSSSGVDTAITKRGQSVLKKFSP